MSSMDDNMEIEKVSSRKTRLLDSIQRKLEKAFPSSVVKVVDNSPSHASHMQNAPSCGTTTHVQIQVVSDAFAGVSILERHKKIYELLRDEILELHAITIDAKTPS